MAEDTSRAWKDQYMLRFPDGMRDRLKNEAARNNRSLNAEIISRLEQSFSRPLPDGVSDPTEWLMIVRGVVDQALQQTKDTAPAPDEKPAAKRRPSIIGPYRKIDVGD